MSGTPRRYHLEARLQSATYNILIATEEDVRQGDFVDYSDYASLSNAHAKLTADRDALLKALELVEEQLEDRYDGSPESSTQWMGWPLSVAQEAIAQAKEQP